MAPAVLLFLHAHAHEEMEESEIGTCRTIPQEFFTESFGSAAATPGFSGFAPVATCFFLFLEHTAPLAQLDAQLSAELHSATR